MSRSVDYVQKKFAPLKQKTLRNAVAHRIRKEFPRLGGPRIVDQCAGLILEVVEQHIRPREHLMHGQVLWMAVSLDDPPARRKRIQDTKLIPVVLDVSTPNDVQARLDRLPAGQRLQQKAIRLCEQAHQQGGLLSNCDLSEILNASESRIAQLLVKAQKESGQMIPRRATLHDVGTGLTHKRIICWKRYAEGKSADVVARETYHSLEAVDRYLSQFDRVRYCREQGMSQEKAAYMLDCSVSLVKEYWQLALDLEQAQEECPKKGKENKTMQKESGTKSSCRL